MTAIVKSRVIQDVRSQLGCKTVASFARKLGMAQATISNAESGNSVLQTATLTKIATAAGLDHAKFVIAYTASKYKNGWIDKAKPKATKKQIVARVSLPTRGPVAIPTNNLNSKLVTLTQSNAITDKLLDFVDNLDGRDLSAHTIKLNCVMVMLAEVEAATSLINVKRKA